MKYHKICSRFFNCMMLLFMGTMLASCASMVKLDQLDKNEKFTPVRDFPDSSRGKYVLFTVYYTNGRIFYDPLFFSSSGVLISSYKEPKPYEYTADGFCIILERDKECIALKVSSTGVMIANSSGGGQAHVLLEKNAAQHIAKAKAAIDQMLIENRQKREADLAMFKSAAAAVTTAARDAAIKEASLPRCTHERDKPSGIDCRD